MMTLPLRPSSNSSLIGVNYSTGTSFTSLYDLLHDSVAHLANYFDNCLTLRSVAVRIHEKSPEYDPKYEPSHVCQISYSSCLHRGHAACVQ